ncbi:MAG: gliding motility-associated C-terminal domain-containing protein, partial [Cytophagaceae bacterium]
MKKLLFGLGLSLLFLISLNPLHAQECSGTVSNGQNLVTNGDFSTGYSGWSHDTRYRRYTPCGNCWSVPGDIFVGSNPSQFNNAFPNITDHHGSPTGQFLMVDGICELGVNVWSQDEILIEPNTNYYFSVWITSLYVSPNRGTLRFDINGQALPETITPTGVAGDWIRYTAVWNSGPNPPSYATISIQNTTTTGCNNGVDFAIDDISFSPGCEFGSPGPTPNLGDDFSICGQTLPITLNPDFNAPTQAATNINYKWYKDGVEVSSGFGPSFYSYNVNEPGVYSVCVDSAGSCPKTAIINITDNYSIDLGPDIMLCDPITATLDARFTSAGVTYQWSRNGNPISGASSRTYTANRPGTYSVVVNDPSCGVQSDEVTIGTQAAEPVNGTYCPESSGGTGTVELSVIGDGKYKWWSAPEGGTALATGPSYSPPLLDGPGPYTYYVEDTSTFAINVGPSSANQMTNPEVMGPSETNKTLLVFNAHKSFSLDSLTVYPYNWHCPTPATGNANTINFIVLDSEGNTVGTSNYTGPCTGQGQPAAPMRVPVGINITAGEGYQLRLHTGSTQLAIFLNGATGDFSYPRTYGEAVEIVANHPNYNVYNNPNAFPGYFNWKITHGINCE